MRFTYIGFDVLLPPGFHSSLEWRTPVGFFLKFAPTSVDIRVDPPIMDCPAKLLATILAILLEPTPLDRLDPRDNFYCLSSF